MVNEFSAWSVVRKLSRQDALAIAGVLLVAALLMFLIRWLAHRTVKIVSPRFRLAILRPVPVLRLLIGVCAVITIVPILIEPTFQNVVMLTASAGLTLGFALKDYGSSLIGGLVTVIENTYQPGDWIEVDGVYGEVKKIGARAVHIVTADDTEVIIPHLRLWSAGIRNSSGGQQSLLCVTDFYLHPEHDASLARRTLKAVAETSPYRKPDSSVVVIILEKPWATHYRLKAYVKESREQFEFITDLTIRGKEAIRALGIRFAQAPYAVNSE